MADIISVDPAVVFKGFPELTAWYRYARVTPDARLLEITWPAQTLLEKSLWIDARSGIRLPRYFELESPESTIEVTVTIYRASLTRLITDFYKFDDEVQDLIESACGLFWLGQ